MLNYLKNIFLDRKIYQPAVFFIILAGIYRRTELLLLNPSYWYDTCALGLNTLKPFYALFLPLDYTQAAPVLFMIISKAFSSVFSGITGQDTALRLLPFISGIISLPLFAVLVQKMFHNKCLTLSALFLLCFNSKAVYYSIEFKQYSLELLFSIILLLIFYNLDLKSISKRRFWFYSVLTAVSIWLAHSSLFIIPAGAVLLFLDAYKNGSVKEFKNFITPFLISLGIFAVFYFIPVMFSMYIDMYNHWKFSDPSFFTLSSFTGRFSDKISTLIELPFGLNVFLYAAANIFIMLYYKKYRALILTGVPFLLVTAAGFLNLYPFQTRLILFLLPLLIILYCQIFMLIKKTRAVWGIAVLFILFFAYKELQKPLEPYIINKSSARELYYALDTGKDDNIIAAEGDVLLKYYSGGAESLIKEEYCWEDFSESKIPEFFETAPKGIYYIYSPFDLADYCKNLKEYLKNNKDIKIIKMNEGIGNSFSAEIEKI